MAIKKIWFLIGSFVLGVPRNALALANKLAAQPKVDVSTPDDDKAALEAASSDADKWAASHKEAPKPPAPAPDSNSNTVTKSTTTKSGAAKASTPPPAATPAPDAKPIPAALPGVKAALPGVTPTPPAAPAKRITGLNEMQGKILSVSEDPKSFRIIVDGGYNVEFTYDKKSSVVNGGSTIAIDDLGYNDVVVVRYAGKDLYAVQIERVSRAPRPE